VVTQIGCKNLCSTDRPGRNRSSPGRTESAAANLDCSSAIVREA